MINTDYALTAEQIANYRRDGFIQLNDVITGPDLERLRGKKMLYFVGTHDQHWIEGCQLGFEYRREVYALTRFARYADEVTLVVLPGLTHYGHIESHNDRMANLMVCGIKNYYS